MAKAKWETPYASHYAYDRNWPVFQEKQASLKTSEKKDKRIRLLSLAAFNPKDCLL